MVWKSGTNSNGPEPEFETSGTFLKRNIEWTSSGIAWSADDKHAQLIIERWTTSGTSRCRLPIGPEVTKLSTGMELGAEEAKEFRGELHGFSIFPTIVLIYALVRVCCHKRCRPPKSLM